MKLKNVLFLMSAMLVLTLSSFGQKITYKVNDMTDQYSYTFYTSNDKNTCLVSEDGNSGRQRWFIRMYAQGRRQRR